MNRNIYNFIYTQAIKLYPNTIKGAEKIANFINHAKIGKTYAGGRGTFKAVAAAYNYAHAVHPIDAWKILDVYRGKNGEHLWK